MCKNVDYLNNVGTDKEEQKRREDINERDASLHFCCPWKSLKAGGLGPVAPRSSHSCFVMSQPVAFTVYAKAGNFTMRLLRFVNLHKCCF